MDGQRVRWARKVSQAKLWPLYQNDAQGIVDAELVDEVGTALYARCESILLVSHARVRCPRRKSQPPCARPSIQFQVTIVAK